MILLTFSNTAKFIISLMLAVMGIIPFEQVEMNRPPAEPELTDFRPGMLPLQTIESKPLDRGDLLAGIEHLGSSEVIPSRTDYRSCQLEDVECEIERMVYTVTMRQKEWEQNNQVVVILEEKPIRVSEYKYVQFVKSSL